MPATDERLESPDGESRTVDWKETCMERERAVPLTPATGERLPPPRSRRSRRG